MTQFESNDPISKYWSTFKIDLPSWPQQPPTPSTLFPYFPPFLPTSFLQKTFSTIQTLNRTVSQFLRCLSEIGTFSGRNEDQCGQKYIFDKLTKMSKFHELNKKTSCSQTCVLFRTWKTCVSFLIASLCHHKK